MRPVAHQPITFVQDNTIPVPLPPSLGYGLLYNWYAATDERGIAPDGWRVPTYADLETLDANADEASDLKSVRTIADGDPYWEVEGNNSTSFNAHPAGLRTSIGTYLNLRKVAYYGINYANASNTSTASYQIYGESDGTTNVKGLGSAFFSSAQSIRCVRDTRPPSETVGDADGNTYTWVQIGAQYWLAQNLKTTKYNNGDDIPTGLDDAAWAATTDGAWAYPNGDATLPI